MTLAYLSLGWCLNFYDICISNPLLFFQTVIRTLFIFIGVHRPRILVILRWLVCVYCNFIIIPFSMIPVYMVELLGMYIDLAVCSVSLGPFECLDNMCCPV